MALSKFNIILSWLDWTLVVEVTPIQSLHTEPLGPQALLVSLNQVLTSIFSVSDDTLISRCFGLDELGAGQVIREEGTNNNLIN